MSYPLLLNPKLRSKKSVLFFIKKQLALESFRPIYFTSSCPSFFVGASYAKPYKKSEKNRQSKRKHKGTDSTRPKQELKSREKFRRSMRKK